MTLPALQLMPPTAPVKARRNVTGAPSIHDERDPSGLPLWARRFCLDLAERPFPERLTAKERLVIARKWAKTARMRDVRDVMAQPQFGALLERLRSLTGWEIGVVRAELHMGRVVRAQLSALHEAGKFGGEDKVKLTTLATGPLFKMAQQRAEANAPQTIRVELLGPAAANHAFVAPTIEIEIPQRATAEP